jgi:hypothetical protein
LSLSAPTTPALCDAVGIAFPELFYLGVLSDGEKIPGALIFARISPDFFYIR